MITYNELQTLLDLNEQAAREDIMHNNAARIIDLTAHRLALKELMIRELVNQLSELKKAG